MITISKPPSRVNPVGIKLFLAGSIEMGKAEDWQTLFVGKIKKSKVRNIPMTIFNPRRDNWNKKWKQTIHNRQLLTKYIGNWTTFMNLIL